MTDFSSLPVDKLLRKEGFACGCGRMHKAYPLRYLAIAPDCLDRVIDALEHLNVKKPFVIMGEHGRAAAGLRVMDALSRAGIGFSSFCFPEGMHILPNEEAVAMIDAAFDGSCDFVLGIGSGVINDLCKLAAHPRGLDCGIVATAPSMDGYASNSSAMELGGVKTTVYTVCPSIVICDTEVMRSAPEIMLRSGFGDMAAKVVSIADWRISHIVCGEYYCEGIAQMMHGAYTRILDNVDGIMRRDERAIRLLTEGLVLSGIASSFSGMSRPASGMEHTVSHLLEMFALARGMQPAPHGIQVGFGLRAALRLYAACRRFTPTREKFELAHRSYSPGEWERELRAAFGAQAQALIDRSLRDRRNDFGEAEKRFAAALAHWDEICAIMDCVLAQEAQITAALDLAGIPGLGQAQLMGYSHREAINAVKFSRDLRSRYIFTSLCWDIGLTSYAALDTQLEEWLHD